MGNSLCDLAHLLLSHRQIAHLVPGIDVDLQLVEKLCARELVRALILPEAQDEKERLILLSLEDAAREAGVDVLVVPAGETTDFHGVRLTILPRTTLSRSTHPISGAVPYGDVFSSYYSDYLKDKDRGEVPYGLEEAADSYFSGLDR